MPVFVWLFCNLGPLPAALAQPSGFIDEKIGGNWNAAVGMAFSKDGNRMYVWEKGGRVWIVENGQRLPNPLIDISEEVGDWKDHGMLGFALDPNFDSNGYFYLLYAVDRHHLLHFGKSSYSASANEYFNASIGRLTRYTARTSDNKRSTDMSSRKILIGESITQGLPILYTGHGVGSLVFGEDGSLLLSIGDGASAGYIDMGFDPANPNDTYITQALRDGIITQKENIGSYRSQQVDCINGKILRVDPATGNGLPGNPYYNSGSPRSASSRVWVLGLRNAFRFSVKPGSGNANFPGILYIGDVGWYVWEEINVATRPGMNFGWPVFEGLEQQEWYFHKQVPNNYAAPNPLYGTGNCTQQYFYYGDMIKQVRRTTAPYFYNPCNYNQAIPNSYRLFVHARPAFEWKHSERGGGSRTGIFNGEDAAVAMIGAANSPVSGPQFSGSSVTGGVWYTGTDFPPQYRNTYFFGDYVGGWIKNSTFDVDEMPRSISNFKDSDAFVVALATNPVSGGIYYIKYATEIHLIRYSSGNLPPKAVATADKLSGASPFTVRFTGSGSSDPEGQSLRYEWNFGDNTPVSTEANPSHTFTASGLASFHVVLKVTDAGGLSSTATLLVSINNTAPVVTITSPAQGTRFPLTQNTVYNLTANVTDREHSGSQLQYQWQTVLHHNDHTHPEPIDSKPSTTTTITPVGCDGEIYFYRISLKVTDAGGLTGSSYVDLYPDCSGGVSKPLTITSPANGATFAAGSNIPLSVSFAEVVRSWARVEYWQGTAKIAEATATPFSAAWQSVPAGTYSIVAKAFDAQGHTAQSDAVAVTVTSGGGGNTGTGRITREYWPNLSGYGVASIPVNSAPSSVSELTLFEGPSNIADNYGTRYRGYVTAPVSGQYTFWIAADNNADLWLSTSEDPSQKVKLAYVNGWTYEREWTKFSTQQSVKVTLEAGRRYYIEALQKEEAGGDHLAVGWQLPNGTLERPIPGNRLSPYGSTPGQYTVTATAGAGGTVALSPQKATYTSGERVTVTATANAGYVFSSWSGSATGSTNPLSLTITDNMAITANFQPGNTGKITREYWQNVYGVPVTNIPLSSPPTSVSELTVFESPINIGDNYGTRIRGYVTAPATGQYTFWLSGDDVAELWLSTSESPAGKVRIAYLDAYTYSREWTRYSTQQSAKINLEAGKRYYVEVLQKEQGGGDHVAVGWQLPNATFERPIPGNRLSPYIQGMSGTAMAATAEPLSDADKVILYPNPFSEGITLAFKEPGETLQEVAVLDILSRVVYRKTEQLQLTHGELTINLKDAKLQTGIYLLRYINSKGKVYLIKMKKS
ncbi:PA14 domain-containing protein [Pontibacter sp. SGAir0037]|uniref:PA14 domain-containing protein n=1 Tax=Pontibacter sp. SGAir0037 TaxID=2571030 RepID=UPI00143E0079|nr:PA14 domain-containing protein [Pontibacter sp. SGAir0037]